MKKIMQLTSLLFLTFILVACNNDATPDSSSTNFETIDLEDVILYQSDGYTVVDVREIDEYETGHIPGSINIPLSIIQDGDLSAFNNDESYVIICRTGNRSQEASQILFTEGYEVVNVSEGMSTWEGEITY